MIYYNMIVLAASIALAVGIFCRLNKMDITKHKFTVILYNVSMIGAILSAGQHAWTDQLDLQDYCILLGAACWILVSYKTWEAGPPQYVERVKR